MVLFKGIYGVKFQNRVKRLIYYCYSEIAMNEESGQGQKCHEKMEYLVLETIYVSTYV
jgi:hypothetical protein